LAAAWRRIDFAVNLLPREVCGGIASSCSPTSGHLVGALAVGPWNQIGKIQAAAQDECRLNRRHLDRFEHEGNLWPDSAQRISAWPDERLVCNCFKVTKGTLVAAQRAGAIPVEALAKATSASTLCGSCQPLLVELAGATPYVVTTPDQASRALKWTAVAALIAVVLLTTVPPLPMSSSIQHWWHDVEAFRRLGTTKQTTSYILVELTFVALGLSLRKRWSRFSFGAFQKKLMQMIAVAVKGIDRLDQIVPAVQELGKRHVG